MVSGEAGAPLETVPQLCAMPLGCQGPQAIVPSHYIRQVLWDGLGAYKQLHQHTWHLGVWGKLQATCQLDGKGLSPALSPSFVASTKTGFSSSFVLVLLFYFLIGSESEWEASKYLFSILC